MNLNRFAQVRTISLLTATLAALLAVFAIPAPARAQQPAPQKSSTPTIQVYSRETIVDVTVADAKGQPVHGLTKANFTVEQDGKPQSIRSFQGFAAPTVYPELINLPPNIYTNFQPATGPLNILLLDDIYGGDTGRVRLEAAHFIKNMAPGTQVALLAMGARLTVLQEPTTDPARLLKVVGTIVDPFFQEGDGCEKLIARNHAVIDQFKEIAAYLSGIKGRKNLIWINRGIPSLVFPAPYTVGPLCPYFTTNLHKTYDLLADAQVTVYPLDPSGVGTTDPGGARAKETGHLAMDAVAEATGGVALYGNNFLDELMVKAVDAGASYYTLSYVPPGVQYDGRYHAISIKVDRPNLHLLYRKGYNAEDAPKISNPNRRPLGPAHDPLAGAVSPNAPPATQLLFAVRVEPIPKLENPGDPPVMGYLDPKLKKKPRQLTRYEIFFMLPMKQIVFADDGDGNHNGTIKFDVAAFDTDGHMVTSISRTWPLGLTNEGYRQFLASPLKFYQQLDLPPGKLTLHLGILDTGSKKVGSLEIPLIVGKKPPAAAPAAKSVN
jgi:VWFA-related protein